MIRSNHLRLHRTLGVVFGASLLLAGAAATSCSSDDETAPVVPPGTGGSGADAGVDSGGGTGGTGGTSATGGTAGTVGTGGATGGGGGAAGTGGSTGGAAGSVGGNGGVAGATGGGAGNGGAGGATGGGAGNGGAGNGGAGNGGAAGCTPVAEICDGHDQDCDGLIDNGANLPAVYESADWFDAGYFGLPSGGLLLTWGEYGAIWDQGTQQTYAFTLAELWAQGSGTPPPATGVDSVVVVPAGAYGATSDSLFVIAGPNIYWMTVASPVWQSDTTQNFLGFGAVTAITILRPGDFPGLTEDFMLLMNGGQFYYYAPSAGVQGPFTVQALLCPTGTTGPCPTGVTAIARVPGTPNANLMVQHNGVTYASPINVAGSSYSFQWTTVDTSTVSCAR